MKSDKYFTPNIEDIRVGYECEVRLIENAQWTNFVVGKNNFEETTIYEYLELDNVRVPYLTKEQIEAEGWVANCFDTEGEEWQMCSFKKGAFECRRWQNENNYIEFHNSRVEGQEDIIYEGECKDINTFRYICKLLGI